MASGMFSLADDAWYLLQRLAVQRRSTVKAVMTDLIRAEGDRSLPRVREGYQRRAEIAEGILWRRGIDPADDDYQRAAATARALLADVDALCTGPDQP
jgi:hypothetical protein